MDEPISFTATIISGTTPGRYLGHESSRIHVQTCWGLQLHSVAAGNLLWLLPFQNPILLHSSLSYIHFLKCCLTSFYLLFPLTQELFQNPHLNYLFQTLNLTHTLLNASNSQLAKDCWICLSITPRDSAFPTSILDWTTGNISLHHSYCGEPLYVSNLKYLLTNQIWNSDKLLESLLTGLPSYNGKPPIGGPITQRVTLLQPAPFCIPRNSWNSSYDQPVGITPKSMCNHTSTLLFATGKTIYNASGPTGHSLTFTGWFPSAYSSTSPIVGATLVGSLTVLERTIKPPPPNSSLLSTSAVVLWYLACFSCVGHLHTSVYLLIGLEPPWYTPVQTFL